MSDLRDRLLAPLLAAACTAVTTGQTPTEPPQGSTLRRLVRHFEFEENEQRPTTMPPHVRRVDEFAGGVVPFGRIELTSDAAHGGRWSLGFALDRETLVAEVVSGVLPVMPGSNYQVTVAVRTAGLDRARARLSAWLYDNATRGPLEGSRVESVAIRSEERCRTLSVEVPAAVAESADLVIEMEVLQPVDLRGDNPDGLEPVFSDLGGRVFFDDLQVWLVPRIDLSSNAPGNVFVAPDPPRLTVRIADLMATAPPAELRVTDIDGRLVHHELLDPAGRAGAQVVELPPLPLGWYQADVVVPGDGPARSGGLARASLNFACCDSTALATVNAPHLGILVPEPTVGSAPLLSMLGTSAAVVTVDAGPMDQGRRARRLGAAIEATARATRELILEVDPDALEPTSTLARRMAIQLGPRVAAWQLGRWQRVESTLGSSRLPEASAASLGLASEGGLTFVPWPAERPGEMADGMRANIVVPYQLRPTGVADLLASWPAPRVVTLPAVPRDTYGPRDRVADLVERTLHAWRAGVEQVLLEQPWTRSLEPDSTFVAIQQLARHLQGRRFGGELTLGEGIEAWLMEPVGDGETVLIAWSDAGPRTASLVLGAGDIRVVDAFGNPQTQESASDSGSVAQILRLSALPLYVTGVDRELARFRVAFSLAPDELPTEHRVHHRELRLTNPWSMPISGTVYLHEGDQWRATPRASRFTIASNETIGLPITVVPARSMVAGPRLLDAEIELTAARLYRFHARALMQAGLADLELHESWRRVKNPTTGREDLVVRVDVRNIADQAVSLVAFVQGAGIGLQRQPIGKLAAGGLATRTFTLPDGVARLVGQSLYIGVDDQERARRLTHAIRMPGRVISD